MAPWVRNLVTIVALFGWVATIVGYLLQGKLPDAPLLGVPGVVWLAMSPNLSAAVAKRRTRPNGDK